MHEHAYAEVVALRDGESVDTYLRCGCGAVRHVYTYVAGIERGRART